jgi:hypothetical protein
MNRNLLFGMAVIIALFGFCDIDIMAQQEIRDVDGIVSSHIVDGMPVFAAIEKEVCQQTFQGGCAFATGSDIIGIWQTIGTTKAVNRIAPYHLFNFRRDGKTAEQNSSSPYQEMNKIIPNFMNSGIMQEYEIREGVLKMRADSGLKIAAIVFYFSSDIPDSIARNALPGIGTPHKGDFLLISPEETTLARKVADE